jgi:hypothetical protein
MALTKVTSGGISDIAAAVEGASDSNKFTDADHSKLNAIEASATADQTNAEIRTAVEAASDSNVFTDADHTKLNAIEASATADQTDSEIRAAVEAASDSNVFTDADHTKLNAIEASATADQTDAEIRTAVESATDSNVFTDADHTKLNGIAASANNYVHPNHSGEVTSTADGATVIADNIVDEANLKVSNAPTNGYVLTAQSGNTGGMTWAEMTGGGPSLGTDSIIRTNAQTISENITIGSTTNGMSAGPITIADGYTVTVNGNWSII